MKVKDGTAALLNALSAKAPFQLLELVERDVRSLQALLPMLLLASTDLSLVCCRVQMTAFVWMSCCKPGPRTKGMNFAMASCIR